MRARLPRSLRGRLTLWNVSVLAVLLLVYATLVFAFQYVVLTRQLLHDEIQDVVTVEGLLYFDTHGVLQLHQDYYSRPTSHLLVDRLMEVREMSGKVLYRSPTLHGMALGGGNEANEGDVDFNEHVMRLSDGTHVFVVSHLHGMQGQTYLIRLGYSLGPLRDRMLQFLLLLLIAGPLALALAALAGQAIATRALMPLERMAARAEGITASNLSDRLEIRNPNDELGHMGRVFNHLLDRLEQSFVQMQRFTADAAHELRTPLAALRTIGEVALEEDGSAESYRETLGSILEETGRLSETIDSLLLLARVEASRPEDQKTSFAATQLVDEILNLLEVVVEERQITVEQVDEPVGRVAVYGDRSLIRLAMMNVLHNGFKFTPNGSTLRIAYERAGEGAGSMLRIAFQDEGPGIPEGLHRRVFERFYTSGDRDTASMSGTGLGLSIAKLIVDRAGGEIWFDEDVAHGARCVMTLPIA